MSCGYSLDKYNVPSSAVSSNHPFKLVSSNSINSVVTSLELPATELASNCYHHMFTGCKSLKTIPELPANDLTNKCYHGMFMNCDGIDKATLPARPCYLL